MASNRLRPHLALNTVRVTRVLSLSFDHSIDVVDTVSVTAITICSWVLR